MRRRGARLGAQLGIGLSRMTYLRSLLRFSVPPVDQVKHVGIDDFAWKRGKSYGTVVVDLDSHAIIESRSRSRSSHCSALVGNA
jgi:transposase